MPGKQNVNQRLNLEMQSLVLRKLGRGGCTTSPGERVRCSPPRHSPKPLVPADRNILALELGFDSMGEVQMTHFQLLFI